MTESALLSVRSGVVENVEDLEVAQVPNDSLDLSVSEKEPGCVELTMHWSGMDPLRGSSLSLTANCRRPENGWA